MAVSKEVKQFIISQNTADLAEMLTKELGGTFSQWLILIQQSDLYANLLDLKTRMWSEGLMYLHDTLLEELKKKGVI